VIPATETGSGLSAVVLFPSWPYWFQPQQATVPPARIAQVVPPPAAIAVAPVIPVTATGSGLAVVVPFPSWP
jgi:hypothetical protein